MAGDLIKLALKEAGYTQKELADWLGVSAAQVSKWKKGEHISKEMEIRMRELAKIGDRHPEVVYQAGSTIDADKWQRMIGFLADYAMDNSETGYDTYPLQDDDGMLLRNVFMCLGDMGAKTCFPEGLDFNYEKVPDLGELEYERLMDQILNQHAISSGIYSAFCVLNDLWGFYAAYINEPLQQLMDSDIFPGLDDIEHCLMHLAFAKADLDRDAYPKRDQFRWTWKETYEGWLNRFRRNCFASNLPMQEEPLRLVLDDPDAVGAAAESAAFGFSRRQIHPDVYFNEILCRLRLITHVQQKITEKLGMTAEDLALDEVELSL